MKTVKALVAIAITLWLGGMVVSVSSFNPTAVMFLAMVAAAYVGKKVYAH